MSGEPPRLVTVDIDGTLTTLHGWLALARAFGREAEYHALMRRLRAGETGEDETIAGLLELAEGRTLAEVEGVVARTPKLAGIPEGVARLHAEGLRAALLTHNPPYITDWYRRFAGFDDAAGLVGRQPVGVLIGRAEGIRADKPRGLSELCARAHVLPAEVVHVGDALPDAEIFVRVGRGIALNARSSAVRAAADLALETNDFAVVVDALLG
jgi:phosphoserine phosphatase